HVWLERPWEIKYVFFVDSNADMIWRIGYAKKYNFSDEKLDRKHIYLDAKAMFTPTNVFASPGKNTIATVLLTFDRNGNVLVPQNELSQFMAKRTVLDSIVLVRRTTPEDKAFRFAHWSQGIPGDSTFSPAVCNGGDLMRYGPKWRSGGSGGDFGCREWTAQLYDWQQPYIDVTTYTRHGNFIGEFVGWSRFEDAAKPIIGMHGKQWLCLHDCPAGEQVGVIGDIRAWTTKHHFPMPVRPKRQPEYPDANYKDDLNEFND
ncbi:MAG: hypothetical protein ACEQSK_11310, partial [Sphingomonadaceae bacterium]